MTYRVAFAISGAVSLGSYEAGTIYEIISALSEHNKNLPENSEKRIEIDVLSGASAGGMTAALIAHKLLHDPAMLDGEADNAAYKAWVEKVDIQGLLTHHDGDFTKTSLLSSNFVGKIAEDLITKRHTNNEIPEPGPHNTAAKKVHLGLAMSNLNGVDYKLEVFSTSEEGLDQGEFIQTRFQDRVTEELTKEYKDKQWEDIITACRGCGAFPFAFSPMKLARNWIRHKHDYASRGASPFNNGSKDENFYYMDGGAFNNYPLGLARTLTRRIDSTPEDFENRYYFYISPNPKVSVRDANFKVNATSGMKDTAVQMAKSIFWQGRFQEWMQVETVNEKIKELDKWAEELLQILSNNINQLQIHNAAYDSLLDALYGNSSSYNDDYQRLEKAYCTTQQHQQLSPLLKETWIKGIVIMEKSGGLENRESMKVYTITTTDDDLASEPLAGFLGFLDKCLREHDYLLGRIRGMQVVEHILNHKNKANALGKHLPLNVTSRAARISEAKTQLLAMELSDITMKDVNYENRLALYKRVRERMKQWLKDENVSWIKTQGIMLASKSYLKNLFEIEKQKLLGITMPAWYR
ncbi:patatin-like phospholipase family protein [Alteromonas sp.]|uniref:patatin-like phospholipase family protein n=1 Tax=Alteromonas sp. TaxID=232 RepID=UPI00257A2636|nr:patatin-like phospholipase family protein [Alteromonas sp.]NQY15894.1 patatin-like phospholipase family protein [Alteromonas sp.]